MYELLILIELQTGIWSPREGSVKGPRESRLRFELSIPQAGLHLAAKVVRMHLPDVALGEI